MSTDKLRVGVIGAGFYATIAHIPALRATGRADVVAVSRRNPDRLALIQKELDILAGYTDWREMLDKSALDAVVVTTPHNLHVAPALAALDCGLHVLLEKPAADTIEGAQTLAAAVAKSNCVFTVAEDVRGMRSWRTIKRMLDAGNIGTLRQIDAVCYADWRSGVSFDDLTGPLLEWLMSSPLLEALGRDIFASNAWRVDMAKMGGDSFNDMGVHLVDLLLWLGGAPAKQVSAFRVEIGEPSAILSMTAQLANGVLLTITYNDNVNTGESALSGQGHMTLYGSAGMLRAEWQGLMKAEASAASILANGVDAAIEFEGETVEPAKAFVASILDGAPNFCTIEDGMNAVALVQSAYRSAEAKQVVQLS